MLTVVTGPPCAGKSTHIAEHAQPGDITIDLDALATALTNGTQPHNYPTHIRYVAQAARTAAINEAICNQPSVDTWIVDTQPTNTAHRLYEQTRAVIITIDPGIATCLARARTRPPHTADIIRTWYATQADTGRQGREDDTTAPELRGNSGAAMAWTSGYRSPPGWTTTRKRILKRDAGICYICTHDGADEVDHIINVAAGGSHQDDNLAAIHKVPCHRDKTRHEQRAARNVPPPPPLPLKRRRPETHPGLVT